MSDWFESVGEVGYKSILVVALLVFGALAVVWTYLTPETVSDASQRLTSEPVSLANTQTQAASPASPPEVIIETSGGSERPTPVSPPLQRAQNVRTEVTRAVGPYTIQVGAFRNEQSAGQKVQELKSQGHDAFLESTSQDGGTIFRVCVGNFPSAADASASLRQLKSQGIDSFVRKTG